MIESNTPLVTGGNFVEPQWSYVDDMIQQRAELREAELHRWAGFAEGKAAPSADDLLRGAPFFKGSLAADVLRYGSRNLEDAHRTFAEEKSARLRAALKSLACEETTEAVTAVVAALRDIELPVHDAEHRLRCNIYRGHLGDVDAAMVMAVDTLSAAFHQDWHLIGDPTRAVWQALGWLAFLSTQFERDERVGPAIRPMASPSLRIECAADEFRIRVERAVVEAAVYDARNRAPD